MFFRYLLFCLFIVFSTVSVAFDKSDILVFKNHKLGTLYVADGEVKKGDKVSVILDGKVECASVDQKITAPVKATKEQESGREPICQEVYTSDYQLLKKHTPDKRKPPIFIGFKTCDVELIKKSPNVIKEKIIQKFITDNKLPTYLAKTANIFFDSHKNEYIYFVGINAQKSTKTKTNLDFKEYLDSKTVSRDLYLYDLSRKNFILKKTKDACCVDEKHSDIQYSCDNVTDAKNACFNSYKIPQLESFVKIDNKFYSTDVYGVNEGMNAFVSEIKLASIEDVFRLPIYSLNSCD